MTLLWTDIIDPATLTGYIRESLSAYEARKGTLAVYLPTREVADVEVRFRIGSTGLIPEAQFRAYDAEPEIGVAPGGKRVTLELPAIGQNIPVSEFTQLRLRNSSDDTVLTSILETTRRVAVAIADRMERLRGTVLETGKATIVQDNFNTDDDFGRSGTHTVTAGTLWATAGVDRLADLQTWADVFLASNGVKPGSLVMTTAVFRALAAGDQFQVQLVNGGARTPTEADVQQIVQGAGLPPITVYDRRTSAGSVLSTNKLLMLPAPVATDDYEGTELGATFWGQTLTSMDPAWGIEESEQPGIVAGVYRNPKPPMIAEVISDAIGMPVLANADLSLTATVL
jgi:hypothetical protein